MENSRNYIAEYIWIWVKFIALYVVGGYISGVMGTNGSFDKWMGFSLATIVFGFAFFNKVIKFNLFGNHDAVIWFWAIKVTLSLIIGIIAFPIVNIYYIIHIAVDIIRRFVFKDT